MKNRTLKRVIDIIKPYKKPILIVSFLSLLVSIAEIVKPYLIKIVMDDYLSQGVYQKGAITIGIIGAIYIGIVLLGNIIDFIATTTTNMIGEDAIYKLRNKLYRYIQHANIPFHDRTPAGTLFVRITNDVEDISTLFKDVISTIIKDILLIIAFIVVMVYLSAQLSMMALLIVPLIMIFSITFTIISNKLEEKSKTARTKVNTFLAESIYGVKLIKIFNIQREKSQEQNELSEDFRKTRTPLHFTTGLLPAIMTILENLAICIIVWACTKHILAIDLPVGLIYMFISYIKQIFDPINRIVENMETVQDAVVSINKVYDILDKEEYLENLEDGIEIKEIQGKIEFKHVWFSYDNKDWVLKDVSFVIEPGQSVAFVGKTGSGKTTITNLINRFYEIQKGEILIDGINIKDINIRSLRSHIGLILQDPFVFARSIRDNIALNHNISDEKIVEAIKLASAEDMIEALTNGINEVSKEQGSSFSAGEKQLLAFARIFAHEPDIFILDEATANIDTQTERAIQKSIDILSKTKTSIFIAHRLSTIVNVDKIIVLQDGSIIEEGNHEELMKTGGYYAKLYQAYYDSLVRTSSFSIISYIKERNIKLEILQNDEILKEIDFINECDLVEQDFRGHSSALRYICSKQMQKYFIKIYENDRIDNLNFIDSIYKKLNIPTAKIIEKTYLEKFNKTYVIYEYIDGKTLKELTRELGVPEIEKIGYRVGTYLSRFKEIKCNKEEVINTYETEFNKLVKQLYNMKNYYEKVKNKELPPINLEKICETFEEYKKNIYKIEPSFIHKDINLNNIIVKNNETYFIDNDGGKFGFRALDFRGICWWTWEGEYIKTEQAMYRGIYQGLFGGNIPDDFHKEIAFTIIYEFLLKIAEVEQTYDMERMEYVFQKFLSIFEKTNYFQDYKFEWFN